MIYDCFIFFNELDLLEIRLGILFNSVDKFILVESDYTFTNKEKPLFFQENAQQFKPYLNKIIHIIYKSNKDANPWNNEYDQRNSIINGLTNIADNDIIMISDVDEIPSPDRISKFAGPIERTAMPLFYYYLNCKKLDNWMGTVFTNGMSFKKYKPQDFRNNRGNHELPIVHGGWHYSYMGGLENIQYKLKSFSETQDLKYMNSIESSINTSVDHLTGIPLVIVNDMPEYIKINIQKFSHLIRKSADTKYSFLMPYYNRECLKITLNSFKMLYGTRTDYEIILIEELKNINNTSYHQKLIDIINEFNPFMLIKLIEYTNRETFNPAPLFNIGARNSSGSHLIITNPECCHKTDILKGLDDEIEKNPNSYIMCACEAVKLNVPEIQVITNDPKFFSHIQWYQHSKFLNRGLHFCSCLSKKLFFDIGGFDIAYENGIAYDDNDFKNTIDLNKIPIILRDDLIAYHIDHDRGYQSNDNLRFKNAAYYSKKWEGGSTPSKKNNVTDIFMTSFFRLNMTRRSIAEIQDRTIPGSYQIHIYDNGSDAETINELKILLDQKIITSLILDSRNTGCSYNKKVFHSMAEGDYYIITDNDIYPPKLNPDWLQLMISIMRDRPQLALLTPQIPPINLMGPTHDDGEVVYCEAVGNVLKLIRKAAINDSDFEDFRIGQYGDDSKLSTKLKNRNWQVGFCKNIFCFHAGQTDKWGYTDEQINKDPRKIGYAPPFLSEADPITYRPIDPSLIYKTKV